jgi:hypothetical protein
MVAEQLLASWHDTPTRAAVTDFVAAATTEDAPTFVLPADRVAVFDNDGTLWSEKPLPIQLDFTLTRLAEQARDDPSLLRYLEANGFTTSIASGGDRDFMRPSRTRTAPRTRWPAPPTGAGPS